MGLLAVLMLATLPLLAASAFSVPTAQTLHRVSYLSLITQSSYRIAFVSQRDGDGDIYVMNADGSSLTNLTNNPAADFSPVWSPDGRRIAYVSWPDENGASWIYVVNADGSNLTRLTLGGGPVWSPR